jgi:hypothetical protein
MATLIPSPPTFIPLPDLFTRHRDTVAAVTAAGVQPPARWRELDAALTTYTASEFTAAQRLADQIVRPVKSVDVAALRAMAIAEALATPGALATVQGAVVSALHAAMLEAWAVCADNAYRQIADQFNAAADLFVAAAQTADPDAAAAEMVAADEPVRQSWLTCAVQSARLDELVLPLCYSAELTGLPITDADERIAQQWWLADVADEAVIPLVCDPGSLHRRRVWEAYENTTGRTGRWGALVAVGATIRAPLSLDGFERYRRPKPVTHHQRQIAGAPRGYVENVESDPEDADYRTMLPPIDVLR